MTDVTLVTGLATHTRDYLCTVRLMDDNQKIRALYDHRYAISRVAIAVRQGGPQEEIDEARFLLKQAKVFKAMRESVLPDVLTVPQLKIATAFLNSMRPDGGVR
jgi:hypothetical protein